MLRRIQPGFGIWLTGLPSSGKTTLAHALSRLLAERDIGVQLLDSDDLRRKLTPNPTYSDEERDWFYDMVTFLAALLTDNGVNVAVAATAPRRAYREAARERLARFAEVYVHCPPEKCRARDPKGLWERADRGEIATLPGAGVPYEPPEHPEVFVDTAHLSTEEAARRILGGLDEQAFFVGWSPLGSLIGKAGFDAKLSQMLQGTLGRVCGATSEGMGTEE
jgi:adenylylsulfate kinase